MAAAEELRADLQALDSKLRAAAAVEKARVEKEGRGFSLEGFLSGQNLSAKYPSGPAFLPYIPKPTLFNLTTGISFRDWAATAVGAAAFYGLGYKHAPTLGMPRLSGNRLGLVLTIPVFAIGYTAGLQKAMARHMGFIENGQPCIYGDGYKKDTDVPYFVRHEVSDRRL